jgi:peptide deformylase
MAIKKILTAPDPFLKQISTPVKEVTKDIQVLMDDMLDTMYDAPGIGLAAVQIGVPLRVIVMDISWRNEDGKKEPYFFVNPEIKVKTKITSTYEEGCLSVPDQYAEIDRPEECEVIFVFTLISGLTKKYGSFFPSSFLQLISITITLKGTPICTAAKPIPGASYIVSSMSSINTWISLVTSFTGVDICFKKGSGAVRIFFIAIKL